MIPIKLCNILAAAIICAATIPIHAIGIIIEAMSLVCFPYKSSSSSGKVKRPILLIFFERGIKAINPNEAHSMNQLVAHPIEVPASIAPITADPPSMVAIKLPVTAMNDPFLRAIKKSE